MSPLMIYDATMRSRFMLCQSVHIVSLYPYLLASMEFGDLGNSNGFIPLSKFVTYA